MEQNSTSTSSDQCSREVTWPVAFFWLISLALNSASQQSGRICDLPYQHPSLLRSLPVICAFDAVNILVSYISRLYIRKAPRAAASEVLVTRFRPPRSSLTAIETNDTMADAITRLNNQRLSRYLTFTLGVLPQCIKLFSSRGIPYIQAIGAMYLVSWVLFESLLLLADTSSLEHSQSPYSQLENRLRNTGDMPQWPLTLLCGLAFLWVRC